MRKFRDCIDARGFEKTGDLHIDSLYSTKISAIDDRQHLLLIQFQLNCKRLAPLGRLTFSKKIGCGHQTRLVHAVSLSETKSFKFGRWHGNGF